MDLDTLDRLHFRAWHFCNILVYRVRGTIDDDRWQRLYQRAKDIEQARAERLWDARDAATEALMEGEARALADLRDEVR